MFAQGELHKFPRKSKQQNQRTKHMENNKRIKTHTMKTNKQINTQTGRHNKKRRGPPTRTFGGFMVTHNVFATRATVGVQAPGFLFEFLSYQEWDFSLNWCLTTNSA